MATRISVCSCKHKFQDKRHGKNKRVFNLTDKDKTWRCTVCENIKDNYKYK